MKKLVVVFHGIALILWVLSACEFPAGPDPEEPAATLSPPAWIHGSWDNFDLFFGFGSQWTFTRDNAVWSQRMPWEDFTVDFGEVAKDPDVQVTDAATSNTYVISMTAASYEGVHLFERHTDTTLLWTSTFNGFVWADAEHLSRR